MTAKLTVKVYADDLLLAETNDERIAAAVLSEIKNPNLKPMENASGKTLHGQLDFRGDASTRKDEDGIASIATVSAATEPRSTSPTDCPHDCRVEGPHVHGQGGGGRVNNGGALERSGEILGPWPKTAGESPAAPATYWLPHNGQGCPVPGDTMIHVRLRDGQESTAPEEASLYVWGIAGSGTITHYRIVKPGGGA